MATAFKLKPEPILKPVQEHLDGSGYPRGLSGEQIITAARILAVANAFVLVAALFHIAENRRDWSEWQER